MRRLALIPAAYFVLAMTGATAAAAWQIVASIRRSCPGLVVFHVENHGDQVRRVTLRAGSWERRYYLPSWGGIHIEHRSSKVASVWWRDTRITRLAGCG